MDVRMCISDWTIDMGDPSSEPSSCTTLEGDPFSEPSPSRIGVEGRVGGVTGRDEGTGPGSDFVASDMVVSCVLLSEA